MFDHFIYVLVSPDSRSRLRMTDTGGAVIHSDIVNGTNIRVAPTSTLSELFANSSLKRIFDVFRYILSTVENVSLFTIRKLEN